jgi:uncharacterized protein
MPGPVAILRELHRLRTHCKNLQDEIERLPKQVKAQQTRITQQEKVLKQTNDQITKLKLGIKDREGKIKDTHLVIGKYEKQRETVGNKKEYDAIQIEILHAKETSQKLESEALGLMEEVEQLQTKVPELEKALAQSKKELADWDKTVKERQGVLNGELQTTLAQIKQVEPGLPEETKQQYDRMVSQRGEDAMAMVNGRTCVACYTEITAQMYNNLLSGRFVLCKVCGRILYLPEEPAATSSEG